MVDVLEVSTDKSSSKNKIYRHGRRNQRTGSPRYPRTQMASKLRIGLFPYLNTQPLIHGLQVESDLDVVLDLPSRIADQFARGDLDVAMVPSIEAATLGAPVLDSVCIASEGPVETVILHHRLPLDRVRTLALDEASRTSGALAKILIAQAGGGAPEGIAFSAANGPPPDADAILVIGDPAFRFSRHGFERLDLGREWQARYSLPFVFAVMVLGPRARQRGMSARMRQARNRGIEAASTIARSYNSGVEAVRAEHYLRSVIRYDLGPREKEGLALFYRLARAGGLLARETELEFHAI